jgi:hypothetical protein
LTIFQEEKLEGYHEFVKKHGLPNDLSAENCIRHLRILSPCSLAAEHEEIPYTTVVQTLYCGSPAGAKGDGGACCHSAI